ncbi:unnamed protein product [Cunninghamella blakesleeana]
MTTTAKTSFLQKYFRRTSITPQESSKPIPHYQNNNPMVFGKHLNDPMRISDRPDMIGHFHDPMSIGKNMTSVGCDVTHTGA